MDISDDSAFYAGELRRELNLRSRIHARGRPHVESFGGFPVVVYMPEEGQHGNFYDPAYSAISARPEWMRRFDKIHAQGRFLPKAERRWRELDSSMSSDALLMNVFCTPGVVESVAIRSLLGVGDKDAPVFGWKARVPLANARFDRTEVDMRWGELLVEAKLTESDFQCREATIVESYRDFDSVFERDLLPRIEIRLKRRRSALELPEKFSQEWEPTGKDNSDIARAYQAEIALTYNEEQPGEPGYSNYQLIRNVLAAYAQGANFCVVHDQRRPDLREEWFQVMAAVKSAEMRTRCKVLTWQELVPLLPEGLREFLDRKYGIVAAGTAASWIAGNEDFE